MVFAAIWEANRLAFFAECFSIAVFFLGAGGGNRGGGELVFGNSVVFGLTSFLFFLGRALSSAFLVLLIAWF